MHATCYWYDESRGGVYNFRVLTYIVFVLLTINSLTRVKYIESHLLRVAYIFHEANPIAIVNIVYTNTLQR